MSLTLMSFPHLSITECFCLVFVVSCSFFMEHVSSLQMVTCRPKDEWMDLRLGQCFQCSKEPCHIGFFRETCTSASRQNAQCIPCSLPPSPNARHISGGLPYTANQCLWACNEGFYRDVGKTDMCILCNTSPCENYTIWMREKCLIGSTKDAECVPLPVIISHDNTNNNTNSSTNDSMYNNSNVTNTVFNSTVIVLLDNSTTFNETLETPETNETNEASENLFWEN